METIPSNPIKLMEAYMTRKNYSKRTVESYVKSINDVIKASGKDVFSCLNFINFSPATLFRIPQLLLQYNSKTYSELLSFDILSCRLW
jgi:hypothetical protein